MLQAFTELRVIHALLDDAEKWLKEQLGVPLCISNCGLCCTRNITTVHSIEASLIISYLLGTGQVHFIDAARGWLLDHHRDITIYEGIPRGVITGKLKDEWKALTWSQCIFYDSSQKTCSIHSLRPLSCRAYGVTRTPEPWCPRPLGASESYDRRMYVGGEPALIIERQITRFKESTKTRNPDWTQMGFLPTMIFRQARGKEFRDLIEDNKIASAKLIGTDFSTQSLYQSHLEAMWEEQGLTKNLIRG